MSFWHWVSGITPPPKPVTDALELIEYELEMLHSEMKRFVDESTVNSPAYLGLLDQLSSLNKELVRRSQQESSVPDVNTKKDN